jgi:hypothetical protein
VTVSQCPSCRCRMEADPRRRVVRMTLSIPMLARAEREAAARGLQVAQWVEELVEVALAERRNGAAARGAPS